MTRSITVCALVLALAGAASAEFVGIINTPGSKVDLSKKLVRGKENLVMFHSKTNQQSFRMLPEFQSLGTRRTDLAVLVVDINSVGSPVSKQYRITTLPAFQLYDKDGNLRAEGPPAYNEALKMIGAGE